VGCSKDRSPVLAMLDELLRVGARLRQQARLLRHWRRRGREKLHAYALIEFRTRVVSFVFEMALFCLTRVYLVSTCDSWG